MIALRYYRIYALPMKGIDDMTNKINNTWQGGNKEVGNQTSDGRDLYGGTRNNSPRVLNRRTVSFFILSFYKFPGKWQARCFLTFSTGRIG